MFDVKPERLLNTSAMDFVLGMPSPKALLIGGALAVIAGVAAWNLIGKSGDSSADRAPTPPAAKSSGSK